MGILVKNRRGQSVLEYSLLIGIVISALLIMQMFIKKHFQGGLKENAEKLGEQFSASGTTTYSKRGMKAGEKQTIEEDITTDATMGKFALPGGGSSTSTGKDVFSYTSRTGGKSETIQKTSTDAAANEEFSWNKLDKTDVGDYGVKIEP